VPLQVEHTSKADMATCCFRGQAFRQQRQIPAPEEIAKHRFRLQGLIGACLAHVQSNVPGALLKLDEEYLHQVRVGLRHLRVALSITQRYRTDDELTTLREQVAKLCIELGRSREWMCLLPRHSRRSARACPSMPDCEKVLALSERARKKQHAGMENNLASPEFQRMLLRFGAWMQNEQWGEAESSLEQFATRALEKRRKQVFKHGTELVGENAAQLHALRIACKKLRYCVEMFGSLFNDSKTKDYVAVLSELQDILGH